jgi:sigma-E factor negative regulatory protein RseA
MTPANDYTPPVAEDLSALCDGEASADSARLLVRQWSTDAALRQRWHEYALVGDVLRSSDLAGNSRGDNTFVARLRQRMAAEGLTGAKQPGAVVTIPPRTRPPVEPATAAVVETHAEQARAAPTIDLAAARALRNRRLRRWSAPVGVAAGVALVAGVVLLGRSQDGGDNAILAAGGPDTQVRMIDRNARHDPRFDPYLAAHKQFQPAVVLAPSSGLLRNATYDVGTER